MAIDYGRFHRLTARAEEIADAPGAPPVIVAVYRHAAQAPLSRYAAAHAAVDDAISRLTRADLALSRQLAAVTRHSDIALAVIQAVLPETRLPATFRSQPTDTDKRSMLGRLLTLLGAHAGQPWADALLQGDFGSVTASFLDDLEEVIQAADALQAARKARSAAFEPAWKTFIAYKRLIRSAFGPSSRQYRRLLVRTLDVGDQDDAPPEQQAASLPEVHTERVGVAEAVEAANAGSSPALAPPCSPRLPVPPLSPYRSQSTPSSSSIASNGSARTRALSRCTPCSTHRPSAPSANTSSVRASGSTSHAYRTPSRA